MGNVSLKGYSGMAHGTMEETSNGVIDTVV